MKGTQREKERRNFANTLRIFTSSLKHISFTNVSSSPSFRLPFPLSIFVSFPANILSLDNVDDIPQSIHCKVEHQAVYRQGLVFELRVSRLRCLFFLCFLCDSNCPLVFVHNGFLSVLHIISTLEFYISYKFSMNYGNLLAPRASEDYIKISIQEK